MEKYYALEVGAACCGRTLWNNLVVGYHTDTLNNHEGFEMLTQNETRFASFDYQGIALITVTNPNKLEISAETEGNLAKAESELTRICEQKGVRILERQPATTSAQR